MRILFFFAFLSWTFSDCGNSEKKSKPKKFKAFDFSYNNFFTTCFSIKFTQSDTVFIRQHFAPSFSDTLESDKSYYALLTDTEKSKFDSLDTSYNESYEDGIEYQFFFDNDTIRKIVYVHSDSIPTELKTFGYWIADMKENLKLFTIDTALTFGSLRHFLPPHVAPPSMKFTPPKAE